MYKTSNASPLIVLVSLVALIALGMVVAQDKHSRDAKITKQLKKGK